MDGKIGLPDIVIKLPAAKDLAREIAVAMQPTADQIQELVSMAWWTGFMLGAGLTLIVASFAFILCLAARKG